MEKETSRSHYMKRASSKMHEAFCLAKDNGWPMANRSYKIKHPEDPDKTYEVLHIEDTINVIVDHIAPKHLTSTWRIIRAGLLVYLPALAKKEQLTQDKVIALKEKMYQKCSMTPSEQQKTDNEAKTSSLRIKAASEEDFSELEKFISSKTRKWGRTTVLWMYASALTGLRPNEWEGTEIISQDDSLVLKVKCLKNDTVRGIGEYRFVDITGLHENEISIIKEHLTLYNEFVKAGAWEDYYTGCRKCLYYANKQVFPRRKKSIQLYTSRHQFTADIKLSGLGSAERSVLLGHNTTATQHDWYGKRAKGKNRVVPRNGKPEMENQVKRGYEDKQNKRTTVVQPDKRDKI